LLILNEKIYFWILSVLFPSFDLDLRPATSDSICQSAFAILSLGSSTHVRADLISFCHWSEPVSGLLLCSLLGAPPAAVVSLPSVFIYAQESLSERWSHLDSGLAASLSPRASSFRLSVCWFHFVREESQLRVRLRGPIPQASTRPVFSSLGP
jgi:hypothetical protein